MTTSWSSYINYALLNSGDTLGHRFEKVLSDAGIFDIKDGTPWATSKNFSLIKKTSLDNEGLSTEINEFKNLRDAINNKGIADPNKGGLRINNEKYLCVSYNDKSCCLYLKKMGGGACVCWTSRTIIIGTFSDGKKMKKDDIERNQNYSDCNYVVENLATFLKSKGF